jgi:RNA polymerase sigma factor (sigma-70 family)
LPLGGANIGRWINSNQDLVSDSELWQRFKSGEESAYAQIFRTYYPSMRSYGIKFGNNVALVEDCIQELFLELWERRASLGPTEHLKPYLLKSIRRKVIRQLAASQKAKKLFASLLPQEYAFEVVFSPEHELVQAEASGEKIKKLQAQLERLPARQKEILYLLFYQDMSYEEIGVVMSLNYQSARNLVHRAIKLLKKNSLLAYGLLVFGTLKNIFG